MENPSKVPWADLVSSIENARIRPPGHQPLNLQAAPAVRLQPKVQRSMALVDGQLREVFRQLVSGTLCWPLLIHGPAGCGKTLAALCLCDYMAHPVFRTVEQLTQEVYRPDAYVWETARQESLFVIDEVGMGDATLDPHLREYHALKRFCDYREEHANRCAIYISNLEPDELKAVYDVRIHDRITCGEVFHLDGPSRRRGG